MSKIVQKLSKNVRDQLRPIFPHLSGGQFRTFLDIPAKLALTPPVHRLRPYNSGEAGFGPISAQAGARTGPVLAPWRLLGDCSAVAW